MRRHAYRHSLPQQQHGQAQPAAVQARPVANAGQAREESGAGSGQAAPPVVPELHMSAE